MQPCILSCILKQQLESNSRVYHHRESSVRKLRSIELLFNRSFTTISREASLGSVNNIPWIYPIILPFINHYVPEVTLATSHYTLKCPPLHSFHWIQLWFLNISSKSFVALILDSPEVTPLLFLPSAQGSAVDCLQCTSHKRSTYMLMLLQRHVVAVGSSFARWPSSSHYDK